MTILKLNGWDERWLVTIMWLQVSNKVKKKVLQDKLCNQLYYIA